MKRQEIAAAAAKRKLKAPHPVTLRLDLNVFRYGYLKYGMKSMKHKKNIIACRIFENEVKAVLPETDAREIHWIDAALHASPQRLKCAISDAISNIDSTRSEIGFLFGNGCHPDMCAIAGQHGVGLPAEKNCIHAFLGSHQAKELERNRTMILSPGWLDAWQGIVEGLGWDEVDVRINMGRYDRILLIDPGLVPVDDERLIEFYDQIQVPIEIMPIDLHHFRSFVMAQ